MSLTHHNKPMNVQLEKLLTIGGAAIIGALSIAVSPANAGGAVVHTDPLPGKTTIRYDASNDTVKACREDYDGTRNCAKWSS